MAPRMCRWVVLVIVNAAAFLVPFGAGWRSSMASDEQFDLPRTGTVTYNAAAAVADAGTILAINSRALFWILLLGMFSGGVYGLLLLGVNGYAIGHALAAVHQVSPAAFWFVLSYAPLEFAAFVAANCAAQMVTWTCFNWLRERPTLEARRILPIVACALLLAGVAAGLEAHAIQRYRSTIE